MLLRLSCSSVGDACSLCLVQWEPESDPVSLAMEPQESVHLLHLIKSENAQFSKVTTVFAVLCREMQDMTALVSTLHVFV